MGPCQSTKNKAPIKVHRVGTMNNEDKAVMQCKLCRDNIKAYIKRLEKNQTVRKERAKEEIRKKDKAKAKMYLSQSKLYSEQVNVANGQLTMIEEQIMMLESAQHQKDAITVLEQGNKVLKKLNEEVNVEKWENIADDISELKQQQDEIANFLKNHNIDEGKFDEELDEELERLMASTGVTATTEEQKEKQTPKVEKIDLPEAGKKEIVVENNIEEKKQEETEEEPEKQLAEMGS